MVNEQMLDNIESVFDGMSTMMKWLKKKKYEENMKRFREVNGHYFDEMMELMEKSDDKDAMASEIAGVFMEGVRRKFKKRGKISGASEVNLTFFMIYYVFPAILLTGSEYCETVADALQAELRNELKNDKIRYADYQTIHDGFNEKILGIF
ncbi:MAG: hypothetical protein K5770_16730 [Lachnospiraceae bacterium]|nr:hypothetical protein [Lachnospiraceae bacterium]